MGLIDNSDIQPTTEGQASTSTQEQIIPMKPVKAGLLEMMKMKEFFGIDSKDKDQDKYLNFFIEWGQDVGKSNVTDLLLELKDWELKLGYPNLGETRASKLYKYLAVRNRMRKAMKEAGQARKEMRLYER